MLAVFRRFLNTWPARLLFLLLIGAFGLWGVADVVRNLGTSSALASIDGTDISQADLQDAAQRQLAQMRPMLGQTQPSAELRRAIAAQALNRLLIQAAIAVEAKRLVIEVPDAALRQAVFAMPGFHDRAGRFDRTIFQNLLANNGLTEPRFLELMRADLANQQILEAVRAGAAAPALLTMQLFNMQYETRQADMVELPFADVLPPAPPARAVLQRWWQNHPEEFSTPELRRIKAVLLTAETLMKSVSITDTELRAAYAEHRAEFVVPEKRSIAVITAPTKAVIDQLSTQWQDGADWSAMQQSAAASGSSAIALDDITAAEIPSPELAQLAFKMPMGVPSAPTQGPLGWFVLRVTKIMPPYTRSLAEVTPQLRDTLARQKAADLVYDRANRVEDALAGGATLSELPDNLGLLAVSGTLDAQGNTASGTPAPIPGGQAMRDAVVAAAFHVAKGEAPHLTEGPDHGWYAVEVDDITPPAPRPFDAVQDAVMASWTRAQVRHNQNLAATKLLTAVQEGQSLTDAALVAGLRVEHTPRVARDGQTTDVPPELVRILFGLRTGDVTMVESQQGFVVAVLTGIISPDPVSNPGAFAQLQTSLNTAMANDLEISFANALRDRGKPRIDQRQFDAAIQQ